MIVETSLELADLATALSAAQKEMGSALKDAKAHHGMYADLASVVHAIKGPLAEQGLSYTQLPIREEQSAGVVTILLHNSGQYIRSSYTLPLAKFDAQSVGSCISYARRYALQAMAGIPADDDDGDAAKQAAPLSKLEIHKEAVGRNWRSVQVIVDAIDEERWDAAVEAWNELSVDDKTAIYSIAPRDGNIAFDTAHRKALKSPEFYAANKAMFGKEESDAGDQ